MLKNASFSKITLLAIIFATIFLTTMIGNYVINARLNKLHETIVEIEKLVGLITYYDEALTMSARMAAYTGNSKWEDRYKEHETLLDWSLQRALLIAPIGSAEVEKAHNILTDIEQKSFDYINQGHLLLAQSLLMSPQYERQKDIYQEGFKKFYKEASAISYKRRREYLDMLRLVQFINYLMMFMVMLSAYIAYASMGRLQKQQQIAISFQKMAALGRLSAGMAHEINNALQPVMGLSEILKRRFEKHEESEDEAKKATMIYENTCYMRDIVASILAQSSGIESQREKRPAKAFFEDIIPFASQVLPPGILMKYNFETLGDDIEISVNRTNIVQIAKNIMLNASDAMKGEGVIEVQARIKTMSGANALLYDLQEGRYCVLTIKDHGSGMDKKTMDSIFDPFFTTKLDRGGTGLGLSMSFGLMKQVGGAIGVESKKKQGSTFSLYFPITG